MDYLQGAPDSYHARKEIARRAVRRSEFEQNPRWADAALNGLIDRKLIETDGSGGCRLTSKDKYRK
jgi:Mn-dependent DtxR family transcriptional regulator